jgi:hypothetical protein
LSLKAKKYGDY